MLGTRFALLAASLALASAASIAADPATLDANRALNPGRHTMSFVLETKAFPKDGEIPAKYTCGGDDLSPALSWRGAPQDTKSFALIVDDPDAPSGTFTHWIVYDLPPATHQLPESVSKTEDLSGRGRQGRNDFHRVGYGGPCPPPGKAHRYFFKLYALNAALNLPAGASRKDVEGAMRGRVLAQAELMGKFAH
ncbi:MAG TPA: YbhB/YbcL family Raf kinase inhibitor-like protein [Terriglobales bacterium]|nr:YbhB/YbcL family Raf kinase inhibitor-like protein [Terriglobales bacterium]